MRTTVAYLYDVEFTKQEGDIDLICDWEDDIVTTAIFVYNCDVSWGDEYQIWLALCKDTSPSNPADASTPIEILKYKDSKGYVHLAQVLVTIRAAQVRM